MFYVCRCLIYKKKIFFFSILIFFFVIPLKTGAANIVFNEIAWMGNLQSYQNEWIELYNPTNSSININYWKIISKRGLKINLQGIIKPKSFYLISRKQLPSLKIDLFFKRGLNNKGDTLYLINNKNKIVDIIDCFDGWFAGNNKTKQTMERVNPFLSGKLKTNWFNSIIPEGTPGKKNSVLFYNINKSTSLIVSNARHSKNNIVLLIGSLWAVLWISLYFLHKKGYLKIVIYKP